MVLVYTFYSLYPHFLKIRLTNTGNAVYVLLSLEAKSNWLPILLHNAILLRSRICVSDKPYKKLLISCCGTLACLINVSAVESKTSDACGLFSWLTGFSRISDSCGETDVDSPSDMGESPA